MAKKRIGLLGGSFDPIHLAHIDLANTALRALDLDHVEFIPTSVSWQKGRLGASPEQRLAMLKLALASEPNLHINPIEIQRGGVTYTYDTVSQLPHENHYFWILGTDQLQNFSSWHRWQDILHYVDLAVALRPGSTLQAPTELAHYLQSHDKTLHNIHFVPSPLSATLIRERLQRHQSVAHLVPEPVQHYIEQQQLYQL